MARKKKNPQFSPLKTITLQFAFPLSFSFNVLLKKKTPEFSFPFPMLLA